ncbi:MAG: hypothetical protein M0Z78_06120 [Betaproteobacteria bacterium]|nr:hypothetical protein [Betaproteobacteria bacterium]
MHDQIVKVIRLRQDALLDQIIHSLHRSPWFFRGSGSGKEVVGYCTGRVEANPTQDRASTRNPEEYRLCPAAAECGNGVV